VADTTDAGSSAQPSVWLDDEQQRAWRSLLVLQGQVRRRLAQELYRETGLSEADYEVLVSLSESEGGCLRPFELGGHTQWDDSRLAHHVTRMVKRGLVERQPCDTDNRGSFVAITAEGRAAIEEAAPLHVAAVRRLFIEPTTPRQLAVLVEISDAVIENLQRQDSP
jgi:DNA-binding MarR family transcriptional regulator